MLLVPQRGDKLRLIEMAMQNARQSFTARRDNENTREKMLDELRVKLHLRNAPKLIECYDISNLQGAMVVGSQATFDEGEPQKALYRRYRIRTVEGQDDFASLYEVLSRRLRRAREENEFPDLWVIDGGKGQLNVALEVLKEHELSDSIDVISLAKQHVLNGPRARCGKIRRARLSAQSQRSHHSAEKLHGALSARAYPRRGSPLCHHLQPRAAPARPAAFGARRYRRNRPRAPARPAAPLRQPAAHPRGFGRSARAGQRREPGSWRARFAVTWSR